MEAAAKICAVLIVGLAAFAFFYAVRFYRVVESPRTPVPRTSRRDRIVYARKRRAIVLRFLMDAGKILAGLYVWNVSNDFPDGGDVGLGVVILVLAAAEALEIYFGFHDERKIGGEEV